jgi:putative alpha-1,2-mannosidase
MGFYPVSPGIPIYALGSPIFRQVRIALGNGKIFTIQATHVSAQNKYIHSATMNGLVWNKPWFSHSDLINGGTLVLDMSSRPNKRWGASENDAPPSWSTMQSPRFASP